ncbi:MAG: hypothetical protein KC464_16035 [Myxococcales bacterium]|nr:hypothetical protein [Myxococcales bacterium]
MGDPAPIVALSAAPPARLAAALYAGVAEDGARAARLRTGAAQAMAAVPEDLDVARWFQAVVELGFLVASADGFADEERRGLARLLEKLTAEAVDHELLETNFRELERGVAAMGRGPRLARAAADVDASLVDDTLGLVALIAMADGELGAPEGAALTELGSHLGYSADQVRAVIDRVAARLEGQLR